MLKEFSDQTKN